MKFDKAIQKICLFKELPISPKWSNFVKKKKQNKTKQKYEGSCTVDMG